MTCYHGVNDGVLYPLREGLLFFKPPRFIPRNELHSISCGRGGGGGGSSSRYVDMNVTLNSSNGSDDDSGGSGKKSNSNSNSTTTAEFTNIQREENPGLNAYIHNVLIPAMKQDAEEEATAVAKKKKLTQNGKSALTEALTKSVTNEDTSTEDEDEDEENDGEENDYDAIEADVAEEDSNEDDDEDDDDDE